jgi:hypothetical protein
MNESDRFGDKRIPLCCEVVVLFLGRKEPPQSGINLLYVLILKTKEPAFLNAIFHRRSKSYMKPFNPPFSASALPDVSGNAHPFFL